MLPAAGARRLLAELQSALDACSARQRQLEQSLRVSRRLLRAWDPAGTSAPDPPPVPESAEAGPCPAPTPSPQELKELELLTQALEKAARVRKGIPKAGGRDRHPSEKSGSKAAASGPAGNRVPVTKPTKGLRQTTTQAKEPTGPKLLSVGDRKYAGIGPQATTCGPRLQDQPLAPCAAPVATEAFTLEQKGTQLRLPGAFRKAAAQNSRLWAQLNSTQTGDSTDATRAAKIHFLRNMQSGSLSPRPSAVEVEAEAQRLQEACAMLRLRMQEELAVAPADWMQEYRCLLTLEGLQAMAGQCLHRLKDLCAAATEQTPGPQLGKPPQTPLPWRGEADPSQSPPLLLYTSTEELQTLAALKLQVAMLEQQIHLEKVLMAELLPLIEAQEPRGPAWLALCRAAHSLLCEGGARFLTVLRDDPAD
ncbi:tubulin epsilon and delta complex protein 2-like [Dipodomys merriami]|uniref:tubulin epsilon and delta complex protein 2-like n=1 Tax=Dipodomys merriami TaxID=94247 RepID=UPI003855AC73